MGVPQLRSYLHTNHRYAFNREQHTQASTNVTGRRKMYIDGANFALNESLHNFLPRAAPLEGGDYQGYANAARNRLQTLRECGFDVIVVWDGVYNFHAEEARAEAESAALAEEDEEEAMQAEAEPQESVGRERELDIRRTNRFHAHERILAGTPSRYDIGNVRPLLTLNQFKKVCCELNIPMMCAIDLDADPWLARLASQDHAYLLSNDADFLLLPPSCSSVKVVPLHSRTFTCDCDRGEVTLSVWNPGKFCQRTGISPVVLPLLGFLTKNDHVSRAEADVFQRAVGSDPDTKDSQRISFAVSFLQKERPTSMEDALSRVKRVCLAGDESTGGIATQRLLTAITAGLAASDPNAVPPERDPSAQGRLHNALRRPEHVKNKAWRRFIEAYRQGRIGMRCVLGVLLKKMWHPHRFFDSKPLPHQGMIWEPVSEAIVGIACQGSNPFRVAWTVRDFRDVGDSEVERWPLTKITADDGYVTTLPRLNDLFGPNRLEYDQRISVLCHVCNSRGLASSLAPGERQWLLPLCAIRLWFNGTHVPSSLALTNWQAVLLLMTLLDLPETRRSSGFDWSDEYAAHTGAIRVTYAWQAMMLQVHELADLLHCEFTLVPADLTRNRGLFLEAWARSEAVEGNVARLHVTADLLSARLDSQKLASLRNLAGIVSTELLGCLDAALKQCPPLSRYADVALWPSLPPPGSPCQRRVRPRSPCPETLTRPRDNRPVFRVCGHSEESGRAMVQASQERCAFYDEADRKRLGGGLDKMGEVEDRHMRKRNTARYEASMH